MNLKGDQDLKRHIGEGGNVNIKVNEELAALEAEILEEKKKKRKNDELNEEETKIQAKKIPTQPQGFDYEDYSNIKLFQIINFL